jgi:GMP synthase (glutamine-hydrolysing)
MRTPGILVLDFGSPTTAEVALRLRQLGVYAEVHPADAEPGPLATLDPRGVVLSGGGPLPVGGDPSLPRRAVLEAGLPVLALGDGMLLLTTRLRGKLRAGRAPGFEVERVGILRQSPMFETLLNEGRFATWMRVGPTVDFEPAGFVVTAKGDGGGVAAMEHLGKRLFALRFHPERPETEHGLQLLANFAHDICECPGAWDLDDHVKMCQVALRSLVGSGRVVVPFDGRPAGVILVTLVARALGEGLVPVLLDGPHLGADRRDAVLAWCRDGLARDASVVPAAELVGAPAAGLDGLARRFEAGFVVVPPGVTVPPQRPERRDGRTAPVTRVAPLGELFPDEVRHLGAQLGVPPALLGD